MTSNFIHDDYYGRIVFDTKTGIYYLSGVALFDIYSLIDIEDLTNKLSHNMIRLILLFNLPFLNERNNSLYPINFKTNDIKLYIVRLNEKESRIIMKVCLLTDLYMKDKINRKFIQDTKIVSLLINIISKNYPSLYKEVLLEIKLGGKNH